jgi:hypothetical protein
MAHRQKFPNFEPGKTNGELEIYKMSRRDLTKKEMVEMKGFEPSAYALRTHRSPI